MAGPRESDGQMRLYPLRPGAVVCASLTFVRSFLRFGVRFRVLSRFAARLARAQRVRRIPYAVGDAVACLVDAERWLPARIVHVRTKPLISPARWSRCALLRSRRVASCPVVSYRVVMAAGEIGVFARRSNGGPVPRRSQRTARSKYALRPLS